MIRLLCLAGVACAVSCAGPPLAVTVPAGPLLIVANQQRGVATMVAVQSGRVVTDIDVDMDPHEAALSPDGRTVALSAPTEWWWDANRIAIVDVATATVRSMIDLGEHRWPHGIAFVDDRTVAVSVQRDPAALLVDIQTGAVTKSMANSAERPV